MRNSIATASNNSCYTDGADTKKFSATELQEEFGDLVAPIPPQRLSKMADVSRIGALHWHAHARCPSLASVFNLAQHLPAVRNWVADRCGIERAVQARSYDVWMQGLCAIAAGSGPDADKARWAIGRLHSDPAPEAQPERDTRTIDLFTRRRA